MGNGASSVLQTPAHAVPVFSFLDVGDVFRARGVSHASYSCFEAKEWECVWKATCRELPNHEPQQHSARMQCCGFASGSLYRPLAWWLALANCPCFDRMRMLFDISKDVTEANCFHAVRVAIKRNNRNALKPLVSLMLSNGSAVEWRTEALLAAISCNDMAAAAIVVTAVGEKGPWPWRTRGECPCTARCVIAEDVDVVKTAFADRKIPRSLARELLSRISGKYSAVRELLSSAILPPDDCWRLHGCLLISSCLRGDLRDATNIVNQLVLEKWDLWDPIAYDKLSICLLRIAVGGVVPHTGRTHRLNAKLVRWVLSKLIRPSNKNFDGATFWYTAKSGRVDILECLLAHFQPSKDSLLGLSAILDGGELTLLSTNNVLQIACQLGHTKLVKRLIDYIGITPSEVRSNRVVKRALSDAWQNERIEILKYFHERGCLDAILDVSIAMPTVGSEKVHGWLRSVIVSSNEPIRDGAMVSCDS